LPTPSRVSCSCLRLRALFVLALLLVLAPPAGAVPLAGQLSIVGSLWLSAGAADFAPAGGGSGSFSVALPSTGSFAGLVGTSGTIRDLDLTLPPAGLPIANVLVLAAAPSFGFRLTDIHAGAFPLATCFAPPAVGQTCTPPLSALQLSNVPFGAGLGSVVSFSVDGTVQDGSDVSSFSAVFTAQFPIAYQHVLATMASGVPVASSYSAVFQVVPVPEASTLASLGIGVALLGLVRRVRS